MRRKKVEAEATSPSGQGRITPADVQQVEFRLAFRGYNERDVDAFLDRLTEDLAAYQEENERLRGAGPAAGPAHDDPAARREAEQILADARAEAARIIEDAEVRAAAGAGTSAEARTALAPFLTKERAFLQSLGSLVQGHAEEVKGMVLAARTASDLPSAAAADVRTPSETVAPGGAPEEEGTLAEEEGTLAEEEGTLAEEEGTVEGGPEAASPEATTPEATTEDAQADARSEGATTRADAPSTTAEEAFAPITVPEVQDDEPPDEPAPAQLRRDSGERSLRELFWGED